MTVSTLGVIEFCSLACSEAFSTEYNAAVFAERGGDTATASQRWGNCERIVERCESHARPGVEG